MGIFFNALGKSEAELFPPFGQGEEFASTKGSFVSCIPCAKDDFACPLLDCF